MSPSLAPAVIAAIVVVAVSGGYLLWLVLGGERAVVRNVRTNLQRGFSRPDDESGAATGIWRKWVGRRLLGKQSSGRLERLLTAAGRPERWPTERIIGVKAVGSLVAAALGALIVVRVGTLQAIGFAVALTVLVFFVPDLLLLNAGIKRRQAVELELPDMLDQMSIAVAAGLGFDAALARVARNGKGVLCGEFVRTLQDIQVGQPRRMAYEGLANRVDVADLRRFIRAVVRAEEYGIPFSDVLFSQAREMRIARRQRAERTAMEIPVRVVFPLILCLLPALMIVILGPAVISIIDALSR